MKLFLSGFDRRDGSQTLKLTITFLKKINKLLKKHVEGRLFVEKPASEGVP